MIYLISFDPKTSKIDHFKPYTNSQRDRATADRLQVELDNLKHHLAREVVLLDAESEDDLKKTHARYFGNEALKESLRKLMGGLSEP